MKIDVIVPVGPGHEELHRRAVGSVHMAIDNADQRGVSVVVMEDFRGEIGRSKARNDAVKGSSADWVFFLDSDDMMHPRCFEHARHYLESFDGYEAIWGLCHKLEGEYILPRMELPNISRYEVLIRHHPMATVKIGHFVRREVALEYPFNESMDCGEDWDYYLRIWKAEKCIKVPHPFYIKASGQHSKGPRSANGRQWTETVQRMLAEARGA